MTTNIPLAAEVLLRGRPAAPHGDGRGPVEGRAVRAQHGRDRGAVPLRRVPPAARLPGDAQEEGRDPGQGGRGGGVRGGGGGGRVPVHLPGGGGGRASRRAVK